LLALLLFLQLFGLQGLGHANVLKEIIFETVVVAPEVARTAKIGSHDFPEETREKKARIIETSDLFAAHQSDTK
jgi:hypothetical protein